MHLPTDESTLIMSKNPLGEPSGFPSTYSPQSLFSIARSSARDDTGIGSELPFDGLDLWNAWELTWLDANGKPAVATAEIRVRATSPNIIESKSLKLYLSSHAMTCYENTDSIVKVIRADLTAAAGGPVQVELLPANAWHDRQLSRLPGTCIDDLPASCGTTAVEPALLAIGDEQVELEELHSHLLYSNCPVTNQPDSGSILIRYSGPRIDPASLLEYLVSYRQHNDFHEACVERIFVDISKYCSPHKLTVYARYNRRGGLDINPFRSNFEPAPENLRLWRQ